jgi:ADP-ribose pyrophosphatase YjhB (NUDIX family)
MSPASLFRYCPQCGQPRKAETPLQPFHCGACDFHYYFNACLAVAAILLGPDDRALFVRRAHEPAKGRLAVPGGFVDLGETAEDALRREIKEEVNLEVGPLEFLCTALNQYEYRGVTYPVLDLAFVTRAQSTEKIAALDGVESFCWLKPSEVDPNEIAFPSIRAALQAYGARATGTLER